MKALISNRKVVFVLIAVMTHCISVGKQALLVQLSFVILLQRARIVSSKPPNVTGKPNKLNQA